MAWTAPMTAVANTAFTAAQFNTYIRDNLLETAPAKATTAGSLIVGNGANSIIERIPASAGISTAESTTSTSFTDLATPGPAVTVTTGTSALVVVSSCIYNTSSYALASYQVSGATTLAASDEGGVQVANTPATYQTASEFFRVTGLTAGSNTFTVKYRVVGGTGNFQRRHLVVIPL